MTYGEFLKKAQTEAVKRNLEESAAILLLEEVSGFSSAELYSKMNQPLPEELEKEFFEKYRRYLFFNEPIQYIIGKCCFYGYDFIVTPAVLIPRFETEELVEQILYRYDRYFKGQDVDVCDVATGSGCIGISLNLEEPHMHVVATDISEEALAVAQKNNQKLQAQVTFLQGDMLQPLQHRKFDIFVSNPPYIPEEEEIMPIVKDNEPSIALFGGKDGMKFYRIILENVHCLLKEKAILCFEHAYDKKEQMIQLAHEYFPESRVEVLKDLAGKDRMTFIYVGDFYE